MVLLYIDLLGMKGRWRSGGVLAARTAHAQIATLVRGALARLPAGSAVSGALQSDAVALVFASTSDAVAVGRALFQDAFFMPNGPSDDRLWFRGVIVGLPDPAPGLTSSTAVPGFPAVTEITYSDELLHAINSEQSGAKGARLLVEDALVTTTVRNRFAIDVGTKRCHPLHAMRFMQGLAGFRDVLWMIPDPLPTWAAWERQEEQVRKLARWTAGSGNLEELLHVGATNIVFAECRAIIQGLGRTGGLTGVP